MDEPSRAEAPVALDYRVRGATEPRAEVVREQITRWVERKLKVVVTTLIFFVLAIILLALVSNMLPHRRYPAMHAAARTDIHTIESALDRYQIDTGTYPTTVQGLNVLLADPGVPNWSGPYLTKLPRDPWGQPYQYLNPSTHPRMAIEIYSTGQDKQPGGGDDIGNWPDE